MSKVYNFSAGPSVFPKSVLEQAKEELLDWQGSGMSVMEMSHRGKHFSIIAEEWGFIGSVILLICYLFMILWALGVSATARDRFGQVLALGVGALIFWHVVVNIGMVTGVMPVVGVTLPLFSYGGSSLLTVMMGFGLLMNVSIRRYAY